MHLEQAERSDPACLGLRAVPLFLFPASLRSFFAVRGVVASWRLDRLAA